MGSIQTSYSARSAVAYPGLIADVQYANRVLSKACEGVVPFGYGVFRGSTKPEDGCKVSGAAPAAGYVVDTTTYAVADQDTKTLTIEVDGGSLQTLLFASATTTAAHVIAAINAQISGVLAEAEGAQVKVSSLSKGAGSSVRIVGGTTALTFDTPVQGVNSTFLGVAVRDHVNPSAYLGQYADKTAAGVITEGPVWVELETAGSVKDPLTVNITTGRIGTTAVGGNYVAINGVLDSAAAAPDDLARIILSPQNN